MDIMFGYAIHKDQQIDYDKNDCRILKLLREKVPSFVTCIACGSCTSTCSSAQFTNFNFRKVHTAIRRGVESQIKKEMSNCMLCGKCQLACPRGVDNRAAIMAIHQAVEQFDL